MTYTQHGEEYFFNGGHWGCSPFGTYLLHTSCGSLVCDTADEAAQMLLLTLRDLSNAVDTRPWYIVAEHMMPRYEAAVAAFVLDTKSETKQWSALVGEANNMWELGVYKMLNEHSSLLKDMLRCGPMRSCALSSRANRSRLSGV